MNPNANRIEILQTIIRDGDCSKVDCRSGKCPLDSICSFSVFTDECLVSIATIMLEQAQKILDLTCVVDEISTHYLKREKH